MSKSLVGVVSSDKVDKTIVVTVQTRQTHPLYKKQYTTNRKFMAHDDQNQARIGDLVEIGETRPLSARKRHTLVRIIEKAAISAENSIEAITKAEEVSAADHVADNKKAASEEEATV